MNEPTQPTDEALFNALKDLIVEAQAVADDHHRPRYARLDQALASARNALLGYWATPQPTQAVPPAGREPLTPEQVAEIADAAHREYDRLVSSGQCAPRWSAVFAYLLEQHHGIGVKGKEAGNADT